MNKQTQLLKNSLPLIGAGLGDKLGIHVVVNGDQAWTDGKTICVPNFNVSSKEEKDAVLGFISHEAAHIKFNSFRGISRSQMAGNPLRKAMHNIFEDLRIENAMIDYMIGSRKWLDQIWVNLQKEGKRPAVTSQDEPASILCDYLLFTCRVKFRDQVHLQDYLDSAEEALFDVFGWKFQSDLDALILPKIPKLRSSVAAFNLAQAVVTLLEDFEPEPEQEPEPEDSNDDSNQDSNDDSDSSSNSDDSDSSSDSNADTSEEADTDSPSDEQASNGEDAQTANDEEDTGQGSDDGESSDTQADDSTDGSTSAADAEGDTSGSDQGESSNADANSDAGTDSNSGAPQSTPSEEQSPSAEDVNFAIASALTAGDEDVKDDMSDFVETMQTLASANEASESVGIPKFRKFEQGDSDYGKSLTSRVKQTSNNLTSRLQGLVQEETKVRCRTATSGRNLNSRVLYRAATGDPRLFRTKSTKTVIDTIVEVSIDNSGSMDEVDTHSGLTYLQIAKEAQVALTLALSKINGVAVTASAFPVAGQFDEVIELLSEGESTKKLAERLYRVDGNGYHTPTASGLWHSLKKVIQSKKERKVVIMVTDGFPNHGQREPLTQLVQRAERNGITVIGIAIGSIAGYKPEFLQYFRNALFISDVSQLKKELFKVAKDLLIN
ncbi:VWA domain-containing protein [Vibrio breoganii]